eukprot:scaffold527624_cov13-Prasinocladus_malaysianus.AAC.1
MMTGVRSLSGVMVAFVAHRLSFTITLPNKSRKTEDGIPIMACRIFLLNALYVLHPLFPSIYIALKVARCGEWAKN